MVTFNFSFQSYDPFIVWGLLFFLLILCYFHSCTPHNSVTFLDIVMKFNRSMYQVKIICGAQVSLFPLLLFLKLCPLDFFFFSPKVLVCHITW